MPRKRKPEEHENHERWLVSYADFITLLFAFFVVMYSISSINEGKYRVLSDALVAAFRDPSRSLDPIQIGKLAKSPNTSPISLPYEYRKEAGEPTRRADTQRDRTDFRSTQHREAASAALKTIGGEIRQAMQSLIDQDLVKVRQGKGWLEIELKANILFPSGSAALTENALPVLRRISEVLRKHPNPVQVEGHTDNLPIRSLVYPSNWELSAARAASVVQLFVQVGMDPKRLAAIGYGEHRPVADNSTPEGRAQNRRVTLVVLATQRETPATPAPAGGAATPGRPATSLAPISGPIQLPGPAAGQ
ncbi:MAG: flagellar motor protein MotD [Gammaproteobacteria bacterium]